MHEINFDRFIGERISSLQFITDDEGDKLQLLTESGKRFEINRECFDYATPTQAAPTASTT